MEIYQKVKEHKYVLKMIVLGDVGVGKTNIIRRILNQTNYCFSRRKKKLFCI